MMFFFMENRVERNHFKFIRKNVIMSRLSIRFYSHSLAIALSKILNIDFLPSTKFNLESEGPVFDVRIQEDL